MTQTQNAGGSGDSVIEYSTDSGSTWTDLGGWAMGCTFDAWDRVTGQRNTLTGEEAIAGFGKLQLTGINLNLVYSDGDDTDPFDTIWTQHIATGGGQFMVRVSPQGTSSGKRYIATNSDAKVDSFTPPDIDASSGDPLMFPAHVTTSGFDKSTH
jgi:hypothetical protein